MTVFRLQYSLNKASTEVLFWCCVITLTLRMDSLSGFFLAIFGHLRCAPFSPTLAVLFGIHVFFSVWLILIVLHVCPICSYLFSIWHTFAVLFVFYVSSICSTIAVSLSFMYVPLYYMSLKSSCASIWYIFAVICLPSLSCIWCRIFRPCIVPRCKLPYLFILS